MEGKQCVRSYPVKEREGGILLYFGDEAHQTPCDLDLPNELVGEDIENIKLKDNVSQFIEILKIKTKINTNKLTEYEETTFTEIKPETE